MAAKKSGKRQRNYTTARQQALVANIPTSKTLAEAAIKAGYPVANARQSAYQALQGLRGRVPDIMDRLGFGEEILIDKYLRRHLDAKKTIFAQHEGRFRDQKRVDSLDTQVKALDMAFLLHGSYAPRDPKEAAQYGVKIIRVDIPRPANEFNQFIDVIPESALSRHGVSTSKPGAPSRGVHCLFPICPFASCHFRLPPTRPPNLGIG
jgi:hypothetical protein